MNTKNRYALIALAILLVVLGIVFLLLRERQASNATPEPPESSGGLHERPSKSAEPSKSVGSIPTVAPQEPTSSPPNFDYVTETLKDPTYDWKQPINFYGKIVDKNNNPVSAASISFSWNDISPEGTSRTTTTSDTGGLFSLEGKTGKRLYVEVSKEGYYTSRQTGVAFEYANPYDGKVTPDPNRPVVFHLRKKGETERLLTRNVRFIFPHGETPTGFDPMRCKMSPDGPMLFAATTISTNENQTTNLRLQIQIRGGGIQIAEVEFPFQAPDDGYLDALDFGDAEKLLNQWPSELQCYFYFGEPRRYGRLQFSRSVLGGRVGVARSQLVLTYWINESGSRNLECEPGKFIQPTPEYYLRPNTPLIDSLRSPH